MQECSQLEAQVLFMGSGCVLSMYAVCALCVYACVLVLLSCACIQNGTTCRLILTIWCTFAAYMS